MTRRHLIRSLAKNDVRLILRDPLLGVLSFVALGLGLSSRFLLPAIDQSLAASQMMPSTTSDLRFSDTYPLWVAFIGLWQAALMPGTVFAFLLLDEKEDDTLTAMSVTPVPPGFYLAYRLAMPLLMAFCFSMLIIPLMGFAPVPWWQLIPLALGASLIAPWTTLLIAVFANDKVQGLAFTKFFGIAGLMIIVAWFVPPPWDNLFLVFPPYLVAKAHWMASSNSGAFWIPLFSSMLILGGGLLLVAKPLSSRLAHH